MSRQVRLALVLACGLVTSACADHTQLIVVVDTDLAVPGELDAVRITVTGPAGQPLESTEALTGDGAPMLPLTLGVRPAGEALGPVDVVAEGLLEGTSVVSRAARTRLVRGEARVLVLFLSRECVGLACPDGQTCVEGECAFAEVPTSELPPWTGTIPRRDGGGQTAPDAGLDGAVDGSAPACTTGTDCDDGVGCTDDVCTDGACAHRPDDGACTAVPGGTCDASDGCQYPSCTPETCTAGPCQTAECVDNRCERTNLCEGGEMCCAGECVAAGCDDGNGCTDDACDTTGCVHTNNAASCDDGAYCNGADTCADGACATHAGTPCSGSAVCDESNDVCTGCLSDADCGEPIPGSWGTCGGFDDACDQTGTHERSVTTFTCVSGTCTGSTSSESEACSRSTDGMSCGTTTCGSFGSCGGFSGTCDESGTHSRTCTDHVCDAGSCADAPRTESASCSRDTDGVSCMGSLCTVYGACTGSTTCDETGTKSRTCTDYACSAGSCEGTGRSESTSCTIDTDGDICNDGSRCTFLDRCSSGFCRGEDQCVAPCVCANPATGGCRDPTNPGRICALR